MCTKVRPGSKAYITITISPYVSIHRTVSIFLRFKVLTGVKVPVMVMAMAMVLLPKISHKENGK